MKVKNKILIITVITLFFLIATICGLFFIFEGEARLLWNNLDFIVNISTTNPYEEKNREIDILKYEIDIELYPNLEKIYGDVRVLGVILKEEKQQIELDFFDNFKIHKLQLNGKETEYSFGGNQITINKSETTSDSFEIRIIYEGTPKNLGFGSFTFGWEGNHRMIYTLSEPIFASTWFPCNDTPSDKALVNISITNDSGMVSVSNGKLISIENVLGRNIYNWVTIYPISTYLISIYSAPYHSYTQQFLTELNDTMNINYYVLPDKLEEAERAFADHPDYLKVFSKMFGEYPFLKEKYGVAQIDWNQGAMESQTITGIGTNFISGASFFSDMLIHEVAHHWWGNAVTPKTWKDTWLSEGFATYSEALFWEKTRGKSALISTMESFSVTNESETLYNPGINIFSQMIYNKGAWVLHMLRREIGDTLFFTTLSNYYQKFKYSNADTYDFKRVCEETSGRNLDKFFDQWVFTGKGKMEIEYSWEVKGLDTNNRIISLSILQIQDGYDCYTFPVDILIEEANGNEYTLTRFINTRDTVITFNISDDITSVELDQDSWLLGTFINSSK